jgi:hypothetical protein
MRDSEPTSVFNAALLCHPSTVYRFWGVLELDTKEKEMKKRTKPCRQWKITLPTLV